MGGLGGPGAQKPLLNPFLDIVDLCDYKIGETWIFGGWNLSGNGLECKNNIQKSSHQEKVTKKDQK